jgi:glycosyltransferase involved in cell wall biosynthesis
LAPRTLLLVHNRYQIGGGEDQVFAAEAALLESRRHRVTRFEEDNSRIANRNSVLTAIDAVWSAKSARSLMELVRRHKPNVAHFHNTFPLISPAAHYAVQREGVPVVQTLHNYRLLCPNATFFRDGAVCEECLERQSLLPAIAHGCYRGSRRATTAVATMLSVHRAAGTWQREVDLYIALSEFARRKFIEGGLPASRIVVKRNFVAPDPGVGAGTGGYALFVGRLSAEKGISVLASAWGELADIPLVVVGDGPLAVQFAASSADRLKPVPPLAATLLGHQPREKVLALMRDARVLIFPSVCYEGSPMAIAEAFACGLPVIASNLGSMAEAVDHQRTGLLFQAGNAADLAAKVRWMFEHPEAMAAMRAAARGEYEEKYTADRNYEELMAIYETAIANKKRARLAAS